MNYYLKFILIVVMTFSGSYAFAQESEALAKEEEQLKIAALEALMSAPPDRALPRVERVIRGNGSDKLKSRALFVLSQIDLPEATTLLLETAKQGGGKLQREAIRMIGISGDRTAIDGLADLYAQGDSKIKKSILHAFLIAGDPEKVYEIAVNAATDKEFDSAVSTLGAMGASDQLRRLKDKVGDSNSSSLIHAYAISGDFESLRELAMDEKRPEQRKQAIRGLGIIGGDEVGAILVELYRTSDAQSIRDAALHGMLVADHDAGVLELFRQSTDASEKRRLLRTLVNMDSAAALEIIDEALGDE